MEAFSVWVLKTSWCSLRMYWNASKQHFFYRTALLWFQWFSYLPLHFDILINIPHYANEVLTCMNIYTNLTAHMPCLMLVQFVSLNCWLFSRYQGVWIFIYSKYCCMWLLWKQFWYLWSILLVHTKLFYPRTVQDYPKCIQAANCTLCPLRLIPSKNDIYDFYNFLWFFKYFH